MFLFKINQMEFRSRWKGSMLEYELLALSVYRLRLTIIGSIYSKEASTKGSKAR